ncbi:MAG: hypothetical protein KBA46_03240 [Candidatus Omnitrophica bacterium]|nr:hypothetical protein [Candidatus Omnitrophota bacterium]
MGRHTVSLRNIKAIIFFLFILLFGSVCFIVGYKLYAYRYQGERYWKKQYALLQDNTKRQIATLISNGGLQEVDLEIMPNALWYHQLNPRYKNNESNSLGFRNQEYPEHELLSRPLIICVGDSTTQNWLKPREEGFPSLLEKNLTQSLPEVSPIVLNAGVGFMTSNLVANLVINKIIHLKPQIVVIKVGYNDIVALCTQKITTFDYTQTFDHPFYQLIFDKAMIKEAQQSYEGKMRLATYITLNSETAFAPLRFCNVNYNVDINKDKFFFYEQHILAIIGALKENNITPVLLDLPFPEGGSGKNNLYSGVSEYAFVNFCNRLNNILEHIAKEHNILLVRIQPVLTADDFWDHCHMTKSGNQKTADVLLPLLRKIVHNKHARSVDVLDDLSFSNP